MSYRLFLLLICLLTLTAGTMALASRTGKSQPASPSSIAASFQIDDEEYAVYSALINNDLGDRGSRSSSSSTADADRVLVIDARTSLWDISVGDESSNFFAELKKSSQELQPETANDLQVKSNEVTNLERKFDIKIKYVLVSDEEIEGFFKSGVDGWKTFYQKYPNSNGFLTLSRVGFNADRTQALVYKGWHCGGLCGSGSYFLLRKKKGGWVVGPSIGPAWVS
jgi:hypothetical protein